MKFLKWMQNKLNGSKGKSKANSISDTLLPVDHMLQKPCKDEFSDWPQALLAIGTFGNRTNGTIAEGSSSSQDCVHEEEEQEEGNFQNELMIYFQGENQEDSDVFYPESSLLPGRGKDRCLDNSKSAIGKKLLSFLLKKMFVCRSGFQVQLNPSFKDPLSSEYRMEKILRAILNKKIYPQGSSSTMVIKKYLENKNKAKSDNDDDELNTSADDGSKWVKTDSEYIVLEI